MAEAHDDFTTPPSAAAAAAAGRSSASDNVEACNMLVNMLNQIYRHFASKQ